MHVRNAILPKFITQLRSFDVKDERLPGLEASLVMNPFRKDGNLFEKPSSTGLGNENTPANQHNQQLGMQPQKHVNVSQVSSESQTLRNVDLEAASDYQGRPLEMSAGKSSDLLLNLSTEDNTPQKVEVAKAEPEKAPESACMMEETADTDEMKMVETQEILSNQPTVKLGNFQISSERELSFQGSPAKETDLLA